MDTVRGTGEHSEDRWWDQWLGLVKAVVDAAAQVRGYGCRTGLPLVCGILLHLHCGKQRSIELVFNLLAEGHLISLYDEGQLEEAWKEMLQVTHLRDQSLLDPKGAESVREFLRGHAIPGNAGK